MMEFHSSLINGYAIMKELIFTFSPRVIVVNQVKCDKVRIKFDKGRLATRGLTTPDLVYLL